MRNPLRSVAAIVIGFVVIGALALGTDALLHSWMPDVFNPTTLTTAGAGILLLTIVYVGVFAIAGCYLAARLAPERPMLHAMILGVLGLVFNVVGTIGQWATAPVWYHVTSLVLVLPYAWLGGWLRERELQHRPATVAAVGV